jgi:ribonuclease R
LTPYDNLHNGVARSELLAPIDSLLSTLLTQNILKEENNTYRLHSHYKIGIITFVQGKPFALFESTALHKSLRIKTESLGGATHGDIVIIKRSLHQRQQNSKVIHLLSQGRQDIIAIVKNGKLFHFGYDITLDIPLKQSFRDQTILVINRTTNTIVKTVGLLTDPTIDDSLITIQYDKDEHFSTTIEKDVAKFSKEINPDDHPHRKDLTHLPFCTIDPVRAKDFDDAIYFDATQQVLYVAIADVSHYVDVNSALDIESHKRTFTLYLPHKSIPMLPRTLSEGLCSLQPNVNRFSYVCEMHFDGLEIKESRLYEAIICSQRRFTYEEVDHLLQHPNQLQKPFQFLEPFNQFANQLRKQRLQKGYDFRSDEITLELNSEIMIENSFLESSSPSHQLVETAMLCANVEAANHLPDFALFRTHEPPSATKIEALLRDLTLLGIFPKEHKKVHDLIEDIQTIAKQLSLSNEVDTLLIKAQMKARYSSTRGAHFGLGFNNYTHFTSPIRRYSDLIVHRLLKKISLTNNNLETIATYINDQEIRFTNIEEEYAARKFARWALNFINQEVDAKVITTTLQTKVIVEKPLLGATVTLFNTPILPLLTSVRIRIDNVNLETSQITGSFIEST